MKMQEKKKKKPRESIQVQNQNAWSHNYYLLIIIIIRSFYASDWLNGMGVLILFFDDDFKFIDQASP